MSLNVPKYHRFCANLVLVTTVLTAPLVAFAGNGAGGYGGPTFAPPTTGTVRMIDEGDVDKAVRTCLYTGDSKRGVRSFAQDVFQILYGVDVGDNLATDVRTTYMGSSYSTNAIEMTLLANLGYKENENKCGPFNSDRCIGSREKPSSGSGFYGEAYGVSTGQKLFPQNVGLGYVEFGLSAFKDVPEMAVTASLPVIIRFKKFHENKTFDKWGRFVSQRRMYEGLKVVVTGNSKMRFNSQETNMPTPLIVSTTPLVHCLNNEIQRYAR